VATTKVQEIHVRTAQELENSILSYIAQGYAVSNRTDETVTLFKKKEFNVLWAIIGFFLCAIPLLIYAIMYSQESDQMIVIRIGQAPAISWTDDRKWWSSDGANWHDAATEIPPGATRSDDQQFWWDGTVWCPMPVGVQAQLESPPPPDAQPDPPVAGGSTDSTPPPDAQTF
jgi:hypothetical protein